MLEELRQEIERLRDRSCGHAPSGSPSELLALAERLSGMIEDLNKERDRLSRWQRDLDDRLLTIETSRFFRMLRWPGRFAQRVRGRAGQILLASPLHSVFQKLSDRARAERYRLWLELQRPPQERPLNRRPAISIVLPVRNPERSWLESAVESVLRQTYQDWQLCVCDDASDDRWVADYFLTKFALEPRVRFVRSAERLGTAGACNLAGQLAAGEYIAFLDQRDHLSPYALYCVAEAVQDRPADLIYSDEDFLDREDHRLQPIFRPAFSQDLLFCCMYLGHFLVARKDRLDRVNWFRRECDGSHDYDLVLRITEDPSLVRHLPRVLYHHRSSVSSPETIARTHAAGLEALTGVVGRRNPQARVESGARPCTYRVRWPLPDRLKASIIICSRNARLLRRCLRAIARRTAFENRELVVVEHRSERSASLAPLIAEHACIAESYVGPFNFSLMNNRGAKRAGGDVLVFLNDDVMPLSAEWLTELLAHAVRPEVGIVGARLLYPSGSIQHAGVAIGISDGAGHPHRGAFASAYWNWLPFTRDVSAVTGACMAIRKEVFQELEGFDESFPVNYNDTDLCLRARKAGYRVIIEPAAVLRHDECQSRLPVVRLAERDRWEERWGEWLARGDPFFSPYLHRNSEDASLEVAFPEHLCPRP